MTKPSLVIIEAFGKKDRVLSLFSQVNIPSFVFATLGNILDLPSHEFAIDSRLMKFENRVPVRDDIYNKIKALDLNDYDQVYIATDNDVVGESIARDFIEITGAKDFIRIRMNDLNLSSLKESLKKRETTLNQKLINEADARRISDRIIGYYGDHNNRKKSISFGRVATPLLNIAAKSDPVVKTITHRVFSGRDPIPYELKVSVKKSLAHLSSIIEKKLGNLTKNNFNFKETTYERTAVPVSKPCSTSDILLRVAGIYDEDIKKIMASLQRNYENGDCSYIRTDSNRLSLDDSSEVAAICQKNDFLIKMEDLANKWFYPTEGEVSHHQHTHPAITPKTSRIMTTYDVNSDLSDKINTELYESAKNSVLDCIYNSRVDEMLIGNIDDALSDLLARAECQPVWKRSFLTKDTGVSLDVIVSDGGRDLKIMSQQNAKTYYSNAPEIEVKSLPRERILLSLLTDSKIGKPSTYIHHCLKLKKHFGEDFNSRPSLFNSISFAESSVPKLLDASVAKVISDILADEKLDVYNKVSESLKAIGISSETLDLASSNEAKSGIEIDRERRTSSDSEFDF